MDRKIYQLLRSKYFSLICAVINGYFAISAVLSGSLFFFIVCSIFCAICTRNYING